jgi:hypothetical protein
MSCPSKGRNLRCVQGRTTPAATLLAQIQEKPGLVTSVPGPAQESSSLPSPMANTESATTPNEGVIAGDVALNPYDMFGDDYALLHPDWPRNGTIVPESANPIVSPAPSRQIQFVMSIVLMHFPMDMPGDIPAQKRQCKKVDSPQKMSPECIPAAAKGKAREPVLDDAVLQYWSGNPVPSNNNPPASPVPNAPKACVEPPSNEKIDIDPIVRDIAAYACHLNELGPKATVCLIYHAHKKLQHSLLSFSQPGLPNVDR